MGPTPSMKYAQIESERKFLLRGVPAGAREVSTILDRYLDGSRLRLRLVTRADGSTGWVYSAYLSSAGSAAAASDQSRRIASTDQPRAVIHGGDGDLTDRTARIASRLPAYSRPADGAQSVFTLQPGDEVYIAEVRGNWLRVETADGMSAWIRR